MSTASAPRPKVALLIVAYRGGDVLLDCLRSLAEHDDEALETRLFVVDNDPPHGDADRIERQHPQVTVIRSSENLGFSGGNNLGWQHVATHWPDVEYLCLLNQDTLVSPHWLGKLVAHLQQHPQAAAVQPKITLHPDTSRLNSAGNVAHYLGFSYCRGNGRRDDGQYDTPIDLACPSGAAALIRAAFIRQHGLFDPHYFLYLEDAELGWRMRLAGQTVRYEPLSVVHHRYDPRAPTKAYYLLERNRWWLLLSYYRCWTLLVLLPAIAVMELGQLLYSATRGLLGQKLRAMAWFGSAANLRRLRQRRRTVQALRRVGDRAFTSLFLGVLELPGGTPALLRGVGNPIFAAYWWVARKLIR